MKKKMLIGKRVLTFAMAWLLVFGQVGTQIVPVFATEVMAEADSVSVNTAAEEAEAQNAAALTKVEGVGFYEDEEGEIHLTWVRDGEGETRYELEITDTQGRQYGWLFIDEFNYASFMWHENDNVIDEDEEYGGYACQFLPDGTAQYILDENGEKIQAFKRGSTYTVRVRRILRAYDETAKEYITASTGEWSDPCTYTLPLRTAQGIASAPAKLTEVKLLLGDEETSVSEPTVWWGGQRNVTGYELSVTDSKGYTYLKGVSERGGAYVPEYAHVLGSTLAIGCNQRMSELSAMSAYTIQNGQYVEAKDASGQPIRNFVVGETYTIAVRAYNRYCDYNAATQAYNEPQYFYGEWSDSVVYQPVGSLAIANLTYSEEVGDYYCFTYDTTLADSTVYYQLATDASFSASSVVGTAWNGVYAGSNYHLQINKRTVVPSKTYYLRVVNYPNCYGNTPEDLTDAQIAALNPAVTSFTTLPVRGVTGLRTYDETDEQFIFWIDTPVQTGTYFEVQVTQNPNLTEWRTMDERGLSDSQVNKYALEKALTFDKTDFPYGTTYVRMVGYTDVRNPETDRRERFYAAPSNVIAVTRAAQTCPIGTLYIYGEYDTGYSFTTTADIDREQSVYYEYSDSPDFLLDKQFHTVIQQTGGGVSPSSYTINYTSLRPGRTYYVRARVYNPNAATEAEKFGAYSNVVKISTQVPPISEILSVITKNSVTLQGNVSRSSSDNYLTGFEFQRKNGKKWVTLKRTTDSCYTDKKLKANTSYLYRVRPYYFDTKTKKTTYGKWMYKEVTTWGGAVNPKARAVGKSSIQIVWDKVAGAKGYEIYRSIGRSEYSESEDSFNNAYSQYKLVKTLGASKKSYTDKGLSQNLMYEYKVVAYKYIDGKKIIISETTKAKISNHIDIMYVDRKANGTVNVTWNKVPGAKKYVVDVVNNETGVYETYKTTKKTKITLPKNTTDENIRYRIRAQHKGSYYSAGDTVTVTPQLKAPTGVKATVSSADGSIKITWKPVPGADYYKVYKTPSSRKIYNKTTKTYQVPDIIQGYDEVVHYVPTTAIESGYRQADNTQELNVTYRIDQKVEYTKNGVTMYWGEGPKTGVTYYYYVVAYKTVDGNVADISSGYSKPAKATLKATKPAKVSSVGLKAAKKKITVSFGQVENADGYEIYRSTSKKKGYQKVGTVSSEKASFTDKYSKKNKIKKGKKYYYKVRAFVYDDAGNKVYSAYSVVKHAKAK